MRALLAVAILIAASLFVALPAEADASDAGLLLYEVNPFDDEGISVHNYGTSDADLRDYLIKDSPKEGSEGKISFSESLVIHPGETITFLKTDSKKSGFADRHPTYRSGENGVKIDSQFALNNSGDDVYLLKGDVIIDCFCFGNGTASDWQGPALKIGSHNFAVRTDTTVGTVDSWKNYRVGWTENFFDPSIKYQADVQPFVFPEMGGIPIYEALEGAKDSVYLTMYILSSANVYGLLYELANRGVSVNILLERSPYNVSDPLSQTEYLNALAKKGADIRFIGGDNERYSYVHAKYCIIDMERVVITSENWTTSNLSMSVVEDPTKGEGNRGWGAIIDSKEYAAFMYGVYQNDSDLSYGDVKTLDQVRKTEKTTIPPYKAPTQKVELRNYSALITPALSPDSSLDAVLYYISQSSKRVYSEQQDLAKDLLEKTAGSPIYAMDQKASKGVDCRIIVNSNVDPDTVNEVNDGTKIRASAIASPYLHNKGMICDDVVLLGSVNWTTNSFSNNRESMAAIISKEVADYYAGFFLADYERSYDYSDIIVQFTEISDRYKEGQEIAVSVSVKQDGEYTFYWDLDGEVRETDIPRTVFRPAAGEHTLEVTAVSSYGAEGSVSAKFIMGDSQGGSSPDLPTEYLAPIIVVIIALAVAVLRIVRRHS